MTSKLLNHHHLLSVYNCSTYAFACKCVLGALFNMIVMDRFVELGSILEPGRPPKTDKSAILVDAVRMVTQLRDEAQKLKDSNTSLQEKIKELKVRLQFIFKNFLFKMEGLVERSLF